MGDGVDQKWCSHTVLVHKTTSVTRSVENGSKFVKKVTGLKKDVTFLVGPKNDVYFLDIVYFRRGEKNDVFQLVMGKSKSFFA